MATYTYPHTQALEQPITMGKKTIAVLEYQPLKLKAVRALGLTFTTMGEKLGWTQVCELARSMTGQLPAYLDQLEGPDAAEMFNIVMYAWGKFLPTGTGE